MFKYGGFIGIGNSIMNIFDAKINQLPNNTELLPTIRAFATATDVIILVCWILAIIGVIIASATHYISKIFFKDDAQKIDQSKAWVKKSWISAIVLFCIPFLVALIAMIIPNILG